jgi:hypothetical protein
VIRLPSAIWITSRENFRAVLESSLPVRDPQSTVGIDPYLCESPPFRHLKGRVQIAILHVKALVG